MHKADIANKLNHAETRSSAYNTSSQQRVQGVLT